MPAVAHALNNAIAVIIACWLNQPALCSVSVALDLHATPLCKCFSRQAQSLVTLVTSALYSIGADGLAVLCIQLVHVSWDSHTC